MSCEVCFQKKKEIKSQGKASQTNFYCVTHNVPVCVIGCYDEHRSIYLPLIKLKKLKLKDSNEWIIYNII